MKRTNLPIFTFIAVFVSILIVGAIIMPYFMETLKKTYLTLQADVNRRQAKYMSQFIKARIDQGVPLDQVAAEIQTGLTGMQFDRGYVCVVDQEDGNYVCHPMAQAVGIRSVFWKEGAV